MITDRNSVALIKLFPLPLLTGHYDGLLLVDRRYSYTWLMTPMVSWLVSVA